MQGGAEREGWQAAQKCGENGREGPREREGVEKRKDETFRRESHWDQKGSLWLQSWGQALLCHPAMLGLPRSELGVIYLRAGSGSNEHHVPSKGREPGKVLPAPGQAEMQPRTASKLRQALVMLEHRF